MIAGRVSSIIYKPNTNPKISHHSSLTTYRPSPAKEKQYRFPLPTSKLLKLPGKQHENWLCPRNLLKYMLRRCFRLVFGGQHTFSGCVWMSRVLKTFWDDSPNLLEFFDRRTCEELTFFGISFILKSLKWLGLSGCKKSGKAVKISTTWGKWYLVGGFNPVEKYSSKWASSPNRDAHQRNLKPTTQIWK